MALSANSETSDLIGFRPKLMFRGRRHLLWLILRDHARQLIDTPCMDLSKQVYHRITCLKCLTGQQYLGTRDYVRQNSTGPAQVQTRRGPETPCP